VKNVYFDNSVISAIAKRDTPAETAAIVRVLKGDDAGKLRLFTSEVTQEEVDKYQGEAKPTVEAIYLLMKKANFVKRQELLGINSFGDKYTWINSPMIEDDALWVDLRKLGLDDLDAHHLMIAVKHGCQVFLTCDGDFLNDASRKATIEARHSIHLRRPSEFVTEEGLA
jgi:predicted nucleic acid-binding protein